MSVLSQESISGLVSAGHQGVWGGDKPAYLHTPLPSAAGGPGAVGPAEVGSVSLGKTKVFSDLNAVLPHLLQQELSKAGDCCSQKHAFRAKRTKAFLVQFGSGWIVLSTC